MVRASLDAKAAVTVGPCRVDVQAADHDFGPVATVTPVGLLLPEYDERSLYPVTSKVTADCLVDRLDQWWATVRARFAHITTLVLTGDNGPENHRHRPSAWPGWSPSPGAPA